MTTVLFYLDPFFELNNPFKMQGWLNWYAKIHEQLIINLPDYEARLMALDAIELDSNSSFSGITISLSQEDLRHGCLQAGNVFQKLEREKINTGYYEQLIIQKLNGFSPSVVCLITESAWLRRALPKSVFLNFELNWFHYDPMPRFWCIDISGYGKGRSLLEYSSEILENMVFGKPEKEFLDEFVEVSRQKLELPPNSVMSVVFELMKELRKRFSKIILLPLASAMPGDGETRVFASLDYYFERVKFGSSCFLITLHPGAVAFTQGEIKYLLKKYPNVIIDDQKREVPLTQYLIPHVDSVVGNFSSISYYAIIFDKELIYIESDLPYEDDYARLTAPVSELISKSDKQTRLKVLYWFLTHYAVSEKNMFFGQWVANFMLEAVGFFKNETPWLLYSRPLTTKEEWMAHEWVPQKNKEQFYYYKWIRNKRYSQKRDLTLCPNILEKQGFINFVLKVSPEQMSLLADTLDSLSEQLNEEWKLTVVADFESPSTMFDEIGVLEWKRVNGESLNEAVNSLIVGADVGWFLFVEPGVLFEPVFVGFCYRYIGLFPEWKYIYFDDDCINDKGEFCSPKFKPDFNLELLRSVPYIGPVSLINIDVLKNVGMEGAVDGYDLTLRVFDVFGRKVFGHVSEVLVHLPEYIFSQYNEEIIFSGLFAHLQRNRLDVKVERSWLEGTFRIKYAAKDSSLVSILILPFFNSVLSSNAEKLACFKSCVGSVIEKTAYKNYEIIVAVDDDEGDELHCYIDELKIDGLVRKVSFSRFNNFSVISNFLVEQAKGEYFVFLQPNLIVIYDDWLEGMLGYFQQPEVGIVRPRLVLSTKEVIYAGEALGMGDTAVVGRVNRNLLMDEPGYMGRALLAQELSSVSAGCMAMQKKMYHQLNGMRESEVENIFSATDLCLRVGQLGYRIIYTPYVALLAHRLEVDSQKKDVVSKEKEYMLKMWLSQLANDPTYNRNLSLKTTDFQVDTSINAHWNPDFRDVPKIYAFPPDSYGVGQYRVRAPINALTKAGVIESGLANDFDNLVYPTVTEIERIKPDVLLSQNSFLDGSLGPWKKYRKFNDIFMVSGLDDLVYMLPNYHPKQGVWPKNVRKKVKELFQNSDRIIVANDALAEEFRKMANDIVVVPNYLENWRWEALNLPNKSSGKKLRVGWAGGQEHIGDLQFILPVVKALHKEVDWVFMGLCLEEFEPYIKEAHSGVEFDMYPQKLADLNLDLAIAPLMHNKFNECKTNLRILEFGFMGWPIVCSDILPYQNAPVMRVANNANEWIRVIREKINEPDELVKEGLELRQWVLDNYMLDNHLDEWAVALLPG